MKTAWISLTFDDALREHLDHVIPLLDSSGLLGTFYPHLSAASFLKRQGEWRQAALRGHEIGNHTVFHPADARKKWVRPGNALDHYSMDRMRLELEFANEFLNAMDGRDQRTFAYPCSNSNIGSRGWIQRLLEQTGLGKTRIAGWVDRARLDWGSTLESYEPIVGEVFAAGRGGGLNRGQATPSVSTWRRTKLPSVAVDNWTLADLQNQVSAAVADDTWAILQFHGVGGGHRMNCSLEIFRDFVAWLKVVHADRVLTVIEGANRLWPDPAYPEAPPSGQVDKREPT